MASRHQERLRDRRSTSRGPDPKQTPTSSTKSAAKNKPKEKTFMDQWVEPPVRATTSYQDHGGAPYGVLENMQPLGEAPNPRAKGRAKPDIVRKSLLGRGAVASGLDAQETPEGTPAPPATPQVVSNGKAMAKGKVDDEKDDDYAPGSKQRGRVAKAKANKRLSEPAPIEEQTPPRSKGKNKSRSLSTTSSTTSRISLQKLESTVKDAVERALRAGKNETGAAVVIIWRQAQHNLQLRSLLDTILSPNCPKPQFDEFQIYVKKAKKTIKARLENNMALDFDVSANSTALQSPPQTEKEKTYIATDGPTKLGRPKISLTVKSPAKPTHKSPHKSPQKHSNSRHSTHGSKAKKHRSDSVGSEESSLSELTDLESDGAEDHMDVDVPTNPTKTTSTRDLAAERGSLNPADRNIKRPSAEIDTAPDEREQVISNKRRKLAETVEREFIYEESDLRTQPRKSTKGRKTRNSGIVLPPLTLAPQRSGAMDSPIDNAPTPTGKNRDISVYRSPSELSSPAIGPPPSPPAHVRNNGDYNYSDYPSPRNPPRQAKTAARDAPKTTGKRAKTKTSPQKKPVYNVAGLASNGGARKESPVGDDDNEELSENNDFCSACSGSGYLLCCDGCDRSFHFSCLDPPIQEDASELNEPWYCFKCVARRPLLSEHEEKIPRGLFAPLLNNLKKRNPTNFALPEEYKDYFENVSSDKNGNFVEAVHTRTSRNRAGYDDVPDYYKMKDSKGHIVTCFYCSKTSAGRRPIITCDKCSEHWHLDCLDPPLANPPARSNDGKKLGDWMCPLHADHELRRMDTRLLNPDRFSRKVHIRRPRNATVVDTSLNRGFRNNGIIDVQDDDDDDESESEFYTEEHDHAVVYRMPASGIKLDFIDRVKNGRVQEEKNDRAFKRARPVNYNTPSVLEQANFARRSIREQQTALNLAQFASVNQDLNLGHDQVQNLVGTLIAEAPPAVVEEMMAIEYTEQARSATSAIPPSPPSSDRIEQLSEQQRKDLEMLQELITRRLAAVNKT
ncbi:Hypothetical protein R9X50_00315600 [Acrodontium crateriforme]|uniref:PHD-type domain-containing protein n=1 Tax=Acrodontium crateriforme TaxID=150365 RepID=A0AAQ3R988_9PEZI|nr:Hypothetical protein R9X50_00315600 [Acrodontium crateriforme]